jgi:hypothetical protein
METWSGEIVQSADSRYDLNALFKKQMGNMTVNVQGLSRVGAATGPHRRCNC